MILDFQDVEKILLFELLWYRAGLVALRTFQAKARRKFSEHISKSYGSAIVLQETLKLQSMEENFWGRK